VSRALNMEITGQDGAYLAELLLAKEYDVRGVSLEVPARMQRRSSLRLPETGIPAHGRSVLA
jgi:GDP-D-mannose dehydratase